MPEPQSTKFGRQPAAELLIQRGLTIAATAATLKVSRNRVLYTVLGFKPPTRRIVHGLCDLIDASPTDLFTPAALVAGVKLEAEKKELKQRSPKARPTGRRPKAVQR